MKSCRLLSKLHANKSLVCSLYHSGRRQILMDHLQCAVEELLYASDIVPEAAANVTAECFSFSTYSCGLMVSGILSQWIRDGMGHTDEELFPLVKTAARAAFHAIMEAYKGSPQDETIKNIQRKRSVLSLHDLSPEVFYA